MGTVVSDLAYAIKNRLNVRFFYSIPDKDGKAGYRSVDAYAIGLLKGTGNLAVLAFYRSGVTYSNNSPMWRTYLIKNIKAVSISGNVFPIRSSYKRYPGQFATIDIQL